MHSKKIAMEMIRGAQEGNAVQFESVEFIRKDKDSYFVNIVLDGFDMEMLDTTMPDFLTQAHTLARKLSEYYLIKETIDLVAGDLPKKDYVEIYKTAKAMFLYDKQLNHFAVAYTALSYEEIKFIADKVDIPANVLAFAIAKTNIQEYLGRDLVSYCGKTDEVLLRFLGLRLLITKNLDNKYISRCI